MNLRALAALCLVMLCGAPPAVAGTFDQGFKSDLKELSRARAGWGLWHLLEAERLSFRVDNGPHRLRNSLETLLDRRQLPPFLRGAAHRALANLAEGAGEHGRARELRATAGIPTHLAVLGPLKGAVSTVPKERVVKGGEPVVGINGDIAWRSFAGGTLGRALAKGDLSDCPGDCHAVYVFDLVTTKEGLATFVVDSNGPIEALLDGAALLHWDGQRDQSRWQHAKQVHLSKGHHRLWISAGHREKTPTLGVRVTDTRDGLLSGSTFLPVAFSKAPKARKPLNPVDAGPLVTYGRDHGLWARLSLHFLRDPAQGARAARLLGAETPVSVGGLRALARAWAKETNAARGAWRDAWLLSGQTDGPSLSALMEFARAHGRQDETDRLCRLLMDVDPHAAEAIACEAGLLRATIGPSAALLRMAARRPATTSSLAFQLLRQGLLAASGQPFEAAVLGLQLSQRLRGAVGLARRSVFALARAGKHDLALRGVADLRKARPFNVALGLLEAEVLALRARGQSTPDLQPALVTLDRLIAKQPTAAELYALRGRLLVESGQRARGLDDVDRALALKPQDRETALWRRSLATGEGFGAGFREAIPPLMALVGVAAGAGAEILLDKRATRFHANGLSSRWRQRVIRILQAGVTQNFEEIRLPFTPRVHRLQVLEAQVIRVDGTRLRPTQIRDVRPRGKTQGVYTQNAFKVIRFPKLRVGDVLHLETRREDVGAASLFGRHFGAFFPAQDRWPSRRTEIIVEAPADAAVKTLQRGEGAWKSKESRFPVGGEDFRRIRWVGTQVPGLDYEPRMPGYGRVGAFVSVTSFGSWDDLVNWYRGFIREQITLPDALAAKALDLVHAAPSVRAKVKAIHGWVVKTTRYVGIEFGIHGFKPYALEEIVRRGYGDCKDKAALFVAMLHAVGIPAEFVLLRTRDRGAIEGHPASLWLFNHAIAYVPDLDTYVDATSELGSLGELPAPDQGATLLRFPIFGAIRGGSQVRVAPFLPPHRNRHESKASFDIDRQGKADGLFEETVTGSQATALRRVFQDKEQRGRTLSRLIGGQYPGAKLDSFEVRGADELGDHVHITMKVSLPRLAQLGEHTMSVPIHADPGGLLGRYASQSLRKHPLQLLQLSREDTHLTIRFPDGVRVDPLPEPVTMKSPWARYTLEFTEGAGRVDVRETLEFTQPEVPATAYPAFRAFLGEIARHRSLRITATDVVL